MGTAWFCLIAVMLAVYVILDGFDLGAGIIHLGVAQNDAERRAVLASIGPVWDANEVWLLAAGGTLFFAFPVLYASGFSGFYLPLMIVLWLLVLRGIAVEFRNHLTSLAWTPLWDVVFAGSSALLAIFYGAALGNVIRGVPLDATGYFFEPLWTNWRLGPSPGILDWYTVATGLTAYFALTQHGALWVAYKTTGIVRRRAQRAARWSWAAAVLFTGFITWSTFRIQPQVPANFSAHPWGWIFPALAMAGLFSVPWLLRPSQNGGAHNTGLAAFLASCAYLSGMLCSAVFGVYPNVLPASIPAYSLTIQNAATSAYGLRVGLVWWLIGMALVASYFIFLYRMFAGKVSSSSAPSDHAPSGRSTDA